MEVSNVRKQSESGTFPNDWKVKSIGNICHAVLDCHHSTPNWTESGYLVVRNQNIRNGKLDLSDPSFTDSRNFVERTRRATPAFGDLIITREAPMGLVCMVPEALECCLGQRMVLLRPKRTEVVPSYLLYTLLGQSVQNAIAVGGGAGSTVSNLRIPVLKSIEIPAPSLIEQTAIATALSDVDLMLNSLDRLIAKKRNLKQAAMQQLLTGQTRLPGFSGEWEVKRLGEVADVFKGNSLSKSSITPTGSHPCILYGELFTSYRRVIYNIVNRTNLLEGFPSIAGDVLLPASTTTTGADLATASALLVDNVALGGDILVIRKKGEKYDPVFLASYLSHTAKHQIAELTQGITIHHLYGKSLKTLVLQIPSVPEQNAIADMLTEIDKELTVLEQRRKKTEALKQGMMQELLTGRTRLL